jgi:hypothetical protein
MPISYDAFIDFLRKEDKEGCVRYVTHALSKSEIAIPELYDKYFLPAVNGFECPILDRQKCEWMQQIQSSIVRTLVECSYPYVLAARSKEIEKSVVVLCPEGEYDEIPARMMSDYFTLEGCRSIFVGADTHAKELASLVSYLHPDILVLNVSNPYHIVSAKNTISSIQTSCPANMEIYVSGSAFEHNACAVDATGATGNLTGYHDVCRILTGGDTHASRK